MKNQIRQVLRYLLIISIPILIFTTDMDAQSLLLDFKVQTKDTILPLKQSGPTEIDLSAVAPSGILFTWTQVKGLASSILSPLLGKTTVTGLKEGEYIFQCQAISGLLSSVQQVRVKVVDYQKKNTSPCRQGGPKTWVLSATSTNDLIRPYLKRDGFDIQGGDTIKINPNPNNGGVYRYFYLGDFGGNEGCPVIVVPNGGVVKIGGTGQRWHIGKNVGAMSDSNFVNHVVFDGTYLRNKGIQYGFQNVGNSWGISATLVSDLEIKGCLFEGNSLGIQMKIYSDSTYPWTVYDNFKMKNIRIHDNYFKTISGGEGFYVGSTDLSGSNQGGNSGNNGPTIRGDSCFIYNNIMDSTGWDAIQVSSMRYTEIHDNIVMNSATKNQSSQNWGILLGGNCTGKIYNNVVYKGTSGTVGTLGYGPTDIYYNFIDSTNGNGIYADMKNGSIVESFVPSLWPALKINVHDNIISRPGTAGTARAIKNQNNEGTTSPGIIKNNYIVNDSRAINNLIYSAAGDVVSDNKVIASFPVSITNLSTVESGPMFEVVQGNASARFSGAKDIIDWLYARLNGAPLPNQPPLSKAGADQVITLPVNSVSLSGSASTDPDGIIGSYLWTKVSGPAQFSITSASASQTTVTGLAQGIYQFELRVTDNQGVFSKDTVQVTVNAAPVVVTNQAPVARAGADQVITLPVNSVSLSGSASTDPDGIIGSYLWTKVSGPAQFSITSASASQTTVTGLAQGIYQFELRVTDNQGVFSKDTVQVTVNAAPVVVTNQAPVARAGADQVITLPVNSVSLSGSASTDPDGIIGSYLWTKVSGPAQFSITSASASQTTVTGLAQGIYQFELRVTDNQGVFSKDTVQVTVNAAPVVVTNQAPVARAGADQIITLPVNSVSLSGSASTDPDGIIGSYLWTKVSGPAQFSITSASASQTTVTGLAQGIYQFELRVTDNQGVFSKDTVQVTVNAAPVVVTNQAPVARAGADQVITLPVNSVSLSGSASTDPDGIIGSYLWTKVSGPAQFSITSASASQTTVTGLAQGIYQFELRVTDNQGVFSKDTVQVTVNAAPVVVTNQAPVARAGADQSITLPANSVTLNGSASVDPDGIITSYLWTKISGPGTFTIVSPTASITALDNLTPGVYVFELKVTDNKGAYSVNTTKITVLAEAKLSNSLVYPNPAYTEMVNLKINAPVTSSKTHIRVYNSKMNLVYQEEFTRMQEHITKKLMLQNLARGFYIVEIIIDANKKQVIKFIKS